jgi:hypothetical protein
MKPVDIISLLQSILNYKGDFSVELLINILRRFAEHGVHLPIHQGLTYLLFVEEFGSQMPIEAIRTRTTSWLETTNHEVREAAGALEALLAKYGMSS